MSEKSHKKYHDPLVVFLDDCFCNDDVASALRAAGFTVEEFTVHFPRNLERMDVREQGVKDPKVIALSHKRGWLILTTDGKMHTAHGDDFRAHPNATVLATTTNCDGDEIWVQAIIKAKVKIESKFKKQCRPWYAHISQQGEITTCQTIDCNPSEKAGKKRPKRK